MSDMAVIWGAKRGREIEGCKYYDLVMKKARKKCKKLHLCIANSVC